MYVTVVTHYNQTNMNNPVFGVYSEDVNTVKETLKNEGRNISGLQFNRMQVR